MFDKLTVTNGMIAGPLLRQSAPSMHAIPHGQSNQLVVGPDQIANSPKIHIVPLGQHCPAKSDERLGGILSSKSGRIVHARRLGRRAGGGGASHGAGKGHLR